MSGISSYRSTTILWAVLALCVCLMPSELSARSKKNTKRGKKGRVIKMPAAVNSRKKELQRLQTVIAQTKQQVRQLSTKEATTQQTLTLFQKQSSQISNHISLLGEEVHALQDSLATMESRQARLERRLREVRERYAAISREVYKQQAQTQNSRTAIAGNSPMPAEEQSVYLKRLTTEMNQTARAITMLQDSLARQKSATVEVAHDRESLLHLKETQQVELDATIVAHRKALDKIRADKSQLQKELAKKEQAAREVTSMISRLIEQQARREKERQRVLAARREAAKRERELHKNSPRHQAQKAEEPADEPKSNFAGRFTWPLSGNKKIVRGFGEYRNSLTHSVMDNPGIDIQASAGTSALAAAGGTVSLVHWLPGYNSIVIVEHGNNYRTVYANLSSAQVRQGQEVKHGSVLGKTGESVDGEFLHFEVWRGRQRVNPSPLLSR